MAATAQPEPTEPAQDTLFFVRAAPLPAFGGQIDVIGGGGPVPGPVVEGKPYSARSITESTQTLADGNRITQRNESVFYRDSKGRTRSEQTLGGVGPWQTDKPVTLINIHDPVAGRSYVLDPEARTANELRPFRMRIDAAQSDSESVEVGVRGAWTAAVPPPPGAAPGVPVLPSGAGVATNVTVVRRFDGPPGGGQVFTQGTTVAMSPIASAQLGTDNPGEDLGEQVLEGLVVKGTRHVETIAAGSMGNERPIEIVTERWYSPDIDAVVLHRFSDPRFGETTYRLVNVVSGEPSPDLFQVPQGYELREPEMPRPGMRTFTLERELAPPPAE
jgi:hypothetical protein